MLIYMYTYIKFKSLFLIYDWPSSVTRPARKMLKARQKGRFITHIHIYTNTPMQAVRRLETVESSPALTHSFALHDRRFITAMYAISLAHTPAQTVFGVALGWVSEWVVGRSFGRVRVSKRRRQLWLTLSSIEYFIFCSVFHAWSSSSSSSTQQHFAFNRFCHSVQVGRVGAGAAVRVTLCVCALYLSLAVLVCAYEF